MKVNQERKVSLLRKKKVLEKLIRIFHIIHFSFHNSPENKYRPITNYNSILFYFILFFLLFLILHFNNTFFMLFNYTRNRHGTSWKTLACGIIPIYNSFLTGQCEKALTVASGRV